MIDSLIDRLKNSFKDLEIWQEKRDTKSFEKTPVGLVVDQSVTLGTAVRVFKDNKVGFAYISGESFDVNAVMERLNFSLQNASEDLDNVIPEPKLEKENYGEFKDEVKRESALAVFGEMEEEAFKWSHIKGVERFFLSDEKSEITLFNSSAGLIRQKLNKISLGAVVIAEKYGEEKIEWDFAVEEELKNLNPKEIMRNACERALKVINSSPTYTGNYSILLESRSASEFLNVLAKSFLASEVYKKRSIISEKTHFSELIDIVEAPLIPQGSKSFYFDGEGFQAVEKVLVKRGEIKQILYDNFYGRKFGVKSTGNSIRTRVSSPPQNGFSNIFINPASRPIDEVLKKEKNVIAITSLIGMHLVNPVTGEISVGFEGYLLQKGEHKKALSNMLLSGNLKDLFSNVVALGSDLTFYGNVGSPSLLVKEMSVAGV